jgi:hypothetical protein
VHSACQFSVRQRGDGARAFTIAEAEAVIGQRLHGGCAELDGMPCRGGQAATGVCQVAEGQAGYVAHEWMTQA